MQIILLESIDKLGKVGDEVTVKNGFARNYLLPQNKALRANNENRKVFESKRAELEKLNADKQTAAETTHKKIDNSFHIIIRQAGEDGRLYGSVNARDIAAVLTEAKYDIDKSQIALDKPIKYLGVFPTKLSLHSEISAVVNVNVARNKDEAEEAKKEFLNPSKKPEEQSEEKTAEPSEGKVEADKKEEKEKSAAKEGKKEDTKAAEKATEKAAAKDKEETEKKTAKKADKEEK